MDVGTLQMDNEGGIGELKNDRHYRAFQQIKTEKSTAYYHITGTTQITKMCLLMHTILEKSCTQIDLQILIPIEKANEIMTKFLGASPLDKFSIPV
jgi:hypothetical protein